MREDAADQHNETLRRPAMRVHGATITAAALALVLMSSGVVAGADTAPAADRGAWRQLGSLDIARTGHTATLLPDQTILVVGGENMRGKPVFAAEIIYPATGASRAAGILPWGLIGHQALALPDGRVLLSGSDIFADQGFTLDPDNCAPYPALTWDPATLTITPVPGLADSNGASATLLDDGRVLFAGGGSECDWNGGDVGLANAVVWDPLSGGIEQAEPMTEARGQHPGVRLGDGRVLVGGGAVLKFAPTAGAYGEVRTLEIWDPVTGEWQLVRFPGVIPTDLVVLDGGLVVMSGMALTGNEARLQVLDPTRDPMALLPLEMPAPRIGAALTDMAGGSLVMVGGLSNDRRPLPTAVFWNPDSGDRSRIMYPKAGADTGHTATTLPDGSIVVIGGRDAHANGQIIGSVEMLPSLQ